MARAYVVYTLAGASRRLYVGVTGDLPRRLAEHRALDPGTFTGRCFITRLVHPEVSSSSTDAIAREKQIKGWSRAEKVALVEETNPTWRDLTFEVLASYMLG